MPPARSKRFKTTLAKDDLDWRYDVKKKIKSTAVWTNAKPLQIMKADRVVRNEKKISRLLPNVRGGKKQLNRACMRRLLR